jgi:hypothetical protein
LPKKRTSAHCTPWTKEDVRELKAHSKARTSLLEIAKRMKRTERALRRKAGMTMGESTYFSPPRPPTAGLQLSGCCHNVETTTRSGFCYTQLQAAATTSRHVLIAAARSTRELPASQPPRASARLSAHEVDVA